MSRSETLEKIISNGAIAVIRLKDESCIQNVVNAIIKGNIRCIEITMTVPNAREIIANLVSEFKNSIILGAGTVTNSLDVEQLIAKGAKFIVSPILNYDIIKVCNKSDVVCMPGCFTPTEIFNAWNSGADMIKVFPATSLGPRYFKDLSAPFPDIKLVPTGGVTIENVGEWILSGASAVGVGSNLFDMKTILENNYGEITRRAEQLIKNIQDARRSMNQKKE